MAARSDATRDRRRQILDAALACFNEVGFANTTIAQIREGAGASTGSIYHHFGGKEQLAGALYVGGIRDVQMRTADKLETPLGAEAGVKILVGSFLRWADESPELAAFCLRSRGAEFLERTADDLAEVNDHMQSRVRKWMQPHLKSGALPMLEPSVYWGILMGPSDHVMRQWAANPKGVDLQQSRIVLERAAWAAMLGLCEEQP